MNRKEEEGGRREEGKQEGKCYSFQELGCDAGFQLQSTPFCPEVTLEFVYSCSQRLVNG